MKLEDLERRLQITSIRENLAELGKIFAPEGNIYEVYKRALEEKNQSERLRIPVEQNNIIKEEQFHEMMCTLCALYKTSNDLASLSLAYSMNNAFITTLQTIKRQVNNEYRINTSNSLPSYISKAAIGALSKIQEELIQSFTNSLSQTNDDFVASQETDAEKVLFFKLLLNAVPADRELEPKSSAMPKTLLTVNIPTIHKVTIHLPKFLTENPTNANFQIDKERTIEFGVKLSKDLSRDERSTILRLMSSWQRIVTHELNTLSDYEYQAGSTDEPFQITLGTNLYFKTKQDNSFESMPYPEEIDVESTKDGKLFDFIQKFFKQRQNP